MFIETQHENNVTIRKILFRVLREMPNIKTKTLKFLQNYATCSCDTTQFLRFLVVVMQFSVILRFSSVQKIQKFGGVFNLKPGKFLKYYVIHRKTFLISVKHYLHWKQCNDDDMIEIVRLYMNKRKHM